MDLAGPLIGTVRLPRAFLPSQFQVPRKNGGIIMLLFCLPSQDGRQIEADIDARRPSPSLQKQEQSIGACL